MGSPEVDVVPKLSLARLAVPCAAAGVGLLVLGLSVREARSASRGEPDLHPLTEDTDGWVIAFDTDPGDTDPGDTDPGDTDPDPLAGEDTDTDAEDTIPPTAAELAGETGGLHCSASGTAGRMPWVFLPALLLLGRRRR